jgi:hypothetical protein
MHVGDPRCDPDAHFHVRASNERRDVDDCVPGCAQVCVILPGGLPVTSQNLNWTPITVAIALTVILAAWFLPWIGARNWYKGKRRSQPGSRRRAAEPRPQRPPQPERNEAEDLDSAGSSRVRADKILPVILEESHLSVSSLGSVRSHTPPSANVVGSKRVP